MAGDKEKYYIGLDCGTNSVGWAVTNEKYKLLRKRGNTMWGMRLFDEAETAAGRRIARSNRRRLARMKRRVKLLQDLFRDEVKKVDPDFYIRLRESFFWEEDKKGFSSKTGCSKNTLFNDVNFTDKDFHKKYPTIWHLRKAIIEADENEHFDIRLYYLAIEHILKHRGHFLREGKIHGAGDFGKLWEKFCDCAEDCGFAVKRDERDTVEDLLKKKMSKTDKKKQLNGEMFDAVDEDFEGTQSELAALLCGSRISLNKLFGLDGDELKLSFSEGAFENNVLKIEDHLSGVSGGMDLILIAKQIYDYIYLSDLLDGDDDISLSVAMVRNYEQHKKDLRAIKAALRPFDDVYKQFFKTPKAEKAGEISYAAHIGEAYTQDDNGRKKFYTVGQDLVNKELKRLFKEHGISGELLARAEDGKLLPKQRGYAKGAIPQQLHHDELVKILNKLAQDFPSFTEEVNGENEKYNTKVKKIERIHDFKIPYYCGPMLARGEKATIFSWAESEIKETVYPWNYDDLVVDKEERANKFIERMTNECTYVVGAKVLPKNSFVYQKYMVLNELNNLKINGRRIDNETKCEIYEKGYLAGELKGNVTLRRLKKWMCDARIMVDIDELGGTNEVKILPKLSTRADFAKILGDDFEKNYAQDKLEQVVKLITILSNERQMLKDKIKETLGCSCNEAEALSKLGYKEWGKFSIEFLNGITTKVDGAHMTILDALLNTSSNLMELLGGDYDFKKALKKANSSKEVSSGNITYEMVKKLYCSPAVKRTVWQAIKIVQEIIKVMGYAPEKIFLEVTRGEEKGEKKIKLSRRKDLLEKYSKIKTDEAKTLFNDLDKKCDDRDLQSKKLFLYYSQMSKCAYCGKHIDLEEINNSKLYDIDHIYPRSKTKDDSITRNLVLVCAHENREKTNHYPIDAEIRERMREIWRFWHDNGLITTEKYNRLMRVNPLTDDELAGFIARQIVETGQSVKAIKDLIEQHMTDVRVVTVKAGNVFDLRRLYGYSGDKNGGIEPMPEFIKIRELNDIHHAKDAYLNIVVGNVMSSTFTDDPYQWVRSKKDSGYKYSIRTELLFRGAEEYVGSDGKKRKWPEVKAWDFADSIKIISNAMKRNDVLWTKMTYEQSGAISDLQLVGKADVTKGILPIKNNERCLHTEKYGGYNSVSGAYFALIEQTDGVRQIVQVPIMAKETASEYLVKKYSDARIIIPKINFKSYLKINGFPCHLTGRTENRLLTQNAVQLNIDRSYIDYLKHVFGICKKISFDKKYSISVEDRIDFDSNVSLFDYILDKLESYRRMPEFGNKIDNIKGARPQYMRLGLEEQCLVIEQLIRILGCNAEKGNLSVILSGASSVGSSRISSKVSNLESAKLIMQSITGLYQREIDLKTVQPGEV